MDKIVGAVVILSVLAAAVLIFWGLTLEFVDPLKGK